MRITRLSRLRIAIGATLVLAALVPITALATPAHRVQAHRPNVVQKHVMFNFGREHGNIAPLAVTVYDDGTVQTRRLNGPAAHLLLSQDTLDGLMKLANAEGFFSLPDAIIGQGLPDIGGRFISIRTPGGTMKTVHVRFVRRPAFDQLYAVLLAATVPGSQ